jgi:L-aminopeptidase/D-esterase-like protein
MSRTIDSVFEFSAYPIYGNKMIVDILQKKLTEIKRNSIYREYRKAVKDYNEGNVKTGTVKDLFNSIK